MARAPPAAFRGSCTHGDRDRWRRPPAQEHRGRDDQRVPGSLERRPAARSPLSTAAGAGQRYAAKQVQISSGISPFVDLRFAPATRKLHQLVVSISGKRWLLYLIAQGSYADKGLSNSARSLSVINGCMRAAAPLYMLSASAALRSCSAKMRSSMVPCATS